MLMSALKPLGELENAPSSPPATSAPRRRRGAHAVGDRRGLRRALIDAIVPRSIARSRPMALPAPVTEARRWPS
jgi:glycine dehydrogenase